MRQLSRWAALGGFLVLMMVEAAPAQQLDSVVGSRGTPTFGTITEMSRTEVAIRSRNGTRKFPVNEIQKVTFAGEPRELRTARGAIRKGQLESARSALEVIVVDDIQREEIVQDIAFYKAYCDARLALVGGGDKAAAVRALRAFETDPANENNYHYYEVMRLLGDLAVALASFENAVYYYGKLGEAPWPDYQMHAQLLQADALLTSEQYEAARNKYDEVLAAGLDDAQARERMQLATLGKAICLAEAGQAQQGVESILAIIQQSDSREKPELFARAYNALGTCHLKADQPQEALLAFLHVDLLFNQIPEAHAEALYYLSNLWRTVNKAERAIRARSVLENRYSGSRWANRE